MTPSTSDQPQMLVEEFEELARNAPELVQLEFINGKVVVKPVRDGNHSEIIVWLQQVCMQHRPDLRLYAECELKIEEYRKGRAKPDGVLAPRKHFVGTGEWAEPDGVLMTVEVTSVIGTRTSATASTSHTATRPRRSPSTFSSIGTRTASPCTPIRRRGVPLGHQPGLRCRDRPAGPRRLHPGDRRAQGVRLLT